MKNSKAKEIQGEIMSWLREPQLNLLLSLTSVTKDSGADLLSRAGEAEEHQQPQGQEEVRRDKEKP